MSRGELLGTVAFSEEKAGTDFKAVETTLKKDGDSFLLDGKKVWVVNGQISGLALVLSKNVEAESDPLALLFADLSEKAEHCAPDKARLGLRSAFANDMEFKSKKLGAEALLVNKDKAERIAEYAMDVAKVILAAAAVGLTFGAMDKAVEHARSRQQFGTNIGQFQAVQWKLADIATEGEGARLQVVRAAWALESEAEKFSTYAAMCKWFASRVARQQSGEALQVMGAAGLSEDCPLEKFYRDAKAMEICLGTSEGQKMQLVHTLQI